MKKKVSLVLTCIALLFASGCGKVVSREEYDKLAGELSSAQTEVASLQDELLKAQQSGYKVAAYASFLDLVSYPLFAIQGVPTRFEFESDQAWRDRVKEGAKLLGDEKLIGYADRIGKEEVGAIDVSAVIEAIDYLIGKIRDESSPS